jgi:hypothetical protein
MRAGKSPEAVQSLEQFYALLRENPWVIYGISEAGFARTIDVAKAERKIAERLFQLLETPLAARRFDYLRKVTRVRLAADLGPAFVVDALADLEPHVHWSADILEARAKAYAAVDHPLAARAQRDWRWFQRHQVEVQN